MFQEFNLEEHPFQNVFLPTPPLNLNKKKKNVQSIADIGLFRWKSSLHTDLHREVAVVVVVSQHVLNVLIQDREQ